MISLKKIVHYKRDPQNYIVVDMKAVVQPIDHPDSYRVSNTQMVYTSRVLAYDEDSGVFETENTIYKPEEVKRSGN